MPLVDEKLFSCWGLRKWWEGGIGSLELLEMEPQKSSHSSCPNRRWSRPWDSHHLFGFSVAWLFPWGRTGHREEFRVCSFCVWYCADNINNCIAVKRDGMVGNYTLECLFLFLLDWRISLACSFSFVISSMLVILKFIIIHWNKLLGFPLPIMGDRKQRTLRGNLERISLSKDKEEGYRRKYKRGWFTEYLTWYY